MSLDALVGHRKLLVIGGTMGAIFTVSTVALFTGAAAYTEWQATAIELLRWGGAIFAAGNVAEHGLKAVRK